MDNLLKNEGNPAACHTCGKEMTGRLGKKFCSDQCRAMFHNRRKSKEEKWIQQLNRILRKNRTVLKTLNPKGQSKVRQEVMANMGFDFRFSTHQYKTAKGDTYYFCYEWGYLVIGEEKIVIVNWQDYMKPESSLSTRANN